MRRVGNKSKGKETSREERGHMRTVNEKRLEKSRGKDKRAEERRYERTVEKDKGRDDNNKGEK